MDKFIKPVDLLSELCSVVSAAKKEILIVCPFPELHHHFKRVLTEKQKQNNIAITFLYGKFSNGSHYELQEADFEFLKTFSNIRIIYHHRLHAKFYANENTALVTSLNINHSSSNNNIEYGIKLDGDKHPLMKEINDFMKIVIEEGELKYKSAQWSNDDTPTNSLDYQEKIQSIKEKYINAYERWEMTDDEKLEKLYCEGKSIKELSEIFKRQPSAISARINKLELVEKYGM